MTRFDLLQDMETVSRDMDQILKGLGFGRFFTPPLAAAPSPPARLRETGDGYTLETAVPGIDPATLEMTVLKDTLTLRGDRATAAPENAVWHRRERNAGPFERSFRLPEGIDAEKAQASCAHGILTVTIPRAQSAQPKKIAIQGA